METERKQKKILFAGLTILVLAGIFLYSASLLDRNTPVIQTTEPQSLALTESEAVVPVADTEPPRVSTLDWKKVQFDACGGKEKYSSLPWWKNFVGQIEKMNYYSDEELAFSMKRALEDGYAYSDSEAAMQTLDSYCADNRRDESRVRICETDRKRKLSMGEDFEYGEGCLSKDGIAFIVVFPGVYMGEANHLFRYDVSGDILEEAIKKIDQVEYGEYGWNAPPSSFGKRVGNIVKMHGGTGDAGCGVTTSFDYDYVANTVTMTERCGMCEGEKPVCKSF